jgi:putative methyltransferase
VRDWEAWHHDYDQPGSPLHRRLLVVQALIAEALERVPAGPISVVSLCAGQGRDLLGVLVDHPRRGDVTARLVELDPRNAEVARARARAAGLDAVEVVTGDAGLSDAYVGAVPADLVVACGIFGNVSDDDIAGTIAALPQLCAPAATVLWTRRRHPPDATPGIRARFEAAGFAELAFVAPPDAFFSVGAHQLMAAPQPLVSGVRFFEFLTDARG